MNTFQRADSGAGGRTHALANFEVCGRSVQTIGWIGWICKEGSGVMTYRSGEVASFEGSVARLARVRTTDMADRHHDAPFPSRSAR